MVGSSPAIFVRDAVVDGIYDPKGGGSLVWNTTYLLVHLSYSAPSTYPLHLEKNDMIAIAENMQ